MSIANTFPVFEPDQVLTKEHLNNLFNYLDQQDRLTRCKLLGSGIVCGLGISRTSDTINITKGCGLTSQGYLILFCDHLGDEGYKYYIPFSRPGFPKDLKLIKQCLPEPDTTNLLFYAAPNVVIGDTSATEFLLLTRAEMDALTDKTGVVALSQANLDEYAVVLFLEAVENNLKNCDTNDCNDKGSIMDFEVKPLLVNKKILAGSKGAGPGASLQHIDLRRYNIPRKNLNYSGAVLDAFVDIVDDPTLELLAKDLDVCFTNYKSLLNGINTSPFGTAADFRNMLQFIIKYYPFLLQYYYAFINDLVKAVAEFRYKVYAIASECCFDEMSFPFHLTLGEATANTALGGQLAYRQYFIYSPLFDGQNGHAEELKNLLMRMILMYQGYLFTAASLSVKSNNPRLPRETRITPSVYGRSFLSERAIPYYYNAVREKGDAIAEDLYYYWNYDKTKRGDARRNLGYNAEDYAQGDSIIHPLLYDIEPYNFFRVEGHIGKNINTALTEIESIRQHFSLPFKVVGLSADFIGALVKGEEPKCCIKHLEADYRVLIAGFICTLHDGLCYAARRPYTPPVQIFVTGIFTGTAFSGDAKKSATGKKAAQPATAANEEAIAATSFINSKAAVALDHPFISRLVNEFQAVGVYTKGSTLSRLCGPPANTFGSYYINSIVANQGVFVNPFPANAAGNDLLYHHLFEFIDSAESMFQMLMNQDLPALDTTAFKIAYNRFEKEVNAINLAVLQLLQALEATGKTPEFSIDAILDVFEYQVQLVLHTCMVEELEALKNEVRRFLAEAQLAKNFNYYYQNHPGLTPGNGVPSGGTIAVVYHEERRGRLVDVNAFLINNNIRSLLVSNFKELFRDDVTPDTLEEKAQQLSLMAVQNDPFVYAQFTNVMRQYIDDCKDLPEEKRNQLIGILRQAPSKQSYELTDGMVIADFYVPYLCCSDCAPVAYILPPDNTTPPPPEDAVFDIQPRVFLFDEAKNYAFTTKPPVTTAGVEQIPFASADVSNPDPDKLNLWTDESNILYLHPAMEIKETIKKTVVYKNISVEITIIKPDATFTAQITGNPTAGTIALQLEAKNQDATEYRWLINGKFPAENKAKTTFPFPAGIPTNQATVELTISYTINDNISEDTQSKLAGTNTPGNIKAAKKPKKK